MGKTTGECEICGVASVETFRCVVCGRQACTRCFVRDRRACTGCLRKGLWTGSLAPPA